MPSTKSPIALQVGAGRLPAGVVPSSALTSLSAGAASATGSSAINVIAVSAASTLPRLGQQMTAVVDNSGGAFTIVLPLDAQVGDVVTLVILGTSLNVVSISANESGSTNTIHGTSTVETLAGSYEVRSFFRSTLTAWLALSEKPAVQLVTSSLTLTRAGGSRLVLVNASAGAVTVTLPVQPQIGDRITILKSVSTTNIVTVQRSGSDTIDGRTTTCLLTALGEVTLVRVAAGVWVTLSETSAVVEITDSFSLSGTVASKEVHVLVRTSNAAWIAGTKSITLPLSTAVQKGGVLTISDADGNAEAANITIVAGVLGVVPAVTAEFKITANYGAVSLINKGTGTNWKILSEEQGLVPNFSVLARADSRVDSSQSRLKALPMYNWNHRKVALHAEFNGLITNILPIEGFSPGGTMVLASTNGGLGNVGVMKTTTTAGSVGYLHYGSLPTDDIFNPTQLLGFRATLVALTANLGTDYDITVGFGSDIGANVVSEDLRLGTNGLYMFTGSTGVWRGARQSSGVAAGVNSATSFFQGNKYILEYYNDGTNWDVYVNGTRSVGGSTNKPTAMLNFGMQVSGAGVSNYVVNVDSFTVFTLDMGNTRFT